MKTDSLSDIAPLLLDWWDKGHADLPWRQTKEPYHIWVSEIMLQHLGGDVKLATNYMISKSYIDAYEKFTHGEGDKVYLPYDASKSMAAFGNLGDLFNQSKS